MTKKIFAAAVLAAGMAATGATAKSPASKPAIASIVCMNLAKANATVSRPNNATIRYTVNAGGNPQDIELEFAGADRVYLDLSGHLVISMKSGEFRTLAATYYQTVDGKRKLVSGNFRVIGAKYAAFHVGKYDTSLPLEIDATVHTNS